MAAQKGHKKAGGRKKGTPNKVVPEIKLLAREYGPEAIEKIVSLMRGQDNAIALIAKHIAGADPMEAGKEVRDLLALLSARNVQNELAAAKEIIDRGWGRPAQPHTGEDGEGPAVVEIRRVIVAAKGNGADPDYTDGGGLPAPTHPRPI